jgi:hypothetical protein
MTADEKRGSTRKSILEALGYAKNILKCGELLINQISIT